MRGGPWVQVNSVKCQFNFSSVSPTFPSILCASAPLRELFLKLKGKAYSGKPLTMRCMPYFISSSEKFKR
jgi:hypothetical protein